MAKVYNQAIAHRFGVALDGFLKEVQWTTFQAAVAWVRRSGSRHLLPALEAFLARGHTVRVTVGIDIESTSKEGLEDLLSLSAHGDSKIYVYHNESGAVFHPKVFLFSNDTDGRLIIGSNNLTESGLYTNTEAALQIDAPIGDAVISDMQNALDTWCDPTDGLAKELDLALLNQLIDLHYVFDEAALNRRRSSSETARGRRGAAGPRVRLFRSKKITPPTPPVRPPGPGGGAGRGAGGGAGRGGGGGGGRGAGGGGGGGTGGGGTNALIMRVRPARGTQVQLPIPLRRSSFFTGQNQIISGHDGVAHPISATRPTRGHGTINTYKVEFPETAGKAIPVVRLDLSPAGITYYVYDSTSPNGAAIVKSLQDGRADGSTVLTKPATPNQSQWYRFI
jgi:uncharacterized membrane protein YgcG